MVFSFFKKKENTPDVIHHSDSTGQQVDQQITFGFLANISSAAGV